MYVCTYIYIYTYTHTHTRTHTHGHAHTHTHRRRHIHIHIYIHMFRYTCISMYVSLFKYWHAYTNTCTNTETHVHTYTYIHIHTHIHKHVCIMYICMYMYIYIYVYTSMHASIRTYIDICMCAEITFRKISLLLGLGKQDAILQASWIVASPVGGIVACAWGVLSFGLLVHIVGFTKQVRQFSSSLQGAQVPSAAVRSLYIRKLQPQHPTSLNP